jgi:hypothetical protein
MLLPLFINLQDKKLSGLNLYSVDQAYGIQRIIGKPNPGGVS